MGWLYCALRLPLIGRWPAPVTWCTGGTGGVPSFIDHKFLLQVLPVCPATTECQAGMWLLGWTKKTLWGGKDSKLHQRSEPGNPMVAVSAAPRYNQNSRFMGDCLRTNYNGKDSNKVTRKQRSKGTSNSTTYLASFSDKTIECIGGGGEFELGMVGVEHLQV